MNFPDFATDSLSIFQLIIEKNGKRKISPDGFLKKRRMPKAGDYKKLRAGEIISYRYDLDMRLLVDNTEHFGKENTDYGRYKIFIIFHDHFLIKKSAIDYLKSNIVEIEYVL